MYSYLKVANLYTFQQFIRGPIDPHPNQYLILSHFLIFVIIVGVKWYLIVDLINIFPITNAVEHFFHVSCPFVFLLLWNDCYCLLPIFKIGIFLIFIGLQELFNYLDTHHLPVIRVELSFHSLWRFFLYGIFAWAGIPNFRWQLNLFCIARTLFVCCLS